MFPVLLVYSISVVLQPAINNTSLTVNQPHRTDPNSEMPKLRQCHGGHFLVFKYHKSEKKLTLAYI